LAFFSVKWAHFSGRSSCAVDALDRVDEELIGIAVAVFIFLGVDAIDGTGVHAGGVLGADTGFCNDVCHFCSLRGSPAASLALAAPNFSTLIVAYGPRGREQGNKGTREQGNEGTREQESE
jgi:hypothetical protein